MTPQNTGFDAFFTTMTSSPEFKAAVTKDWKGDATKTMEASLLEMEAGAKKAGDLMSALETTFKTPEAVQTGESLHTDGGYGQTATKTEEPKDKNALEVEYFTMKNPETWGFKGIAGMDDLKKELSESFIAPLRFKLLVEKLKKESPRPNPLPGGEGVRKENSPKYIIDLARKGRSGQTSAEEFLWEILRDRKFENLKFRRQHPIRRYIADFYCDELGLVIELDGKIHENQKEYDTIRDEFMQSGGYKIMRVINDEIFNNTESVLDKIFQFKNSPLSSGRGVGGEGSEDPKIALYKKLSEAYDKFQVSIPTGLLFYGPPGTGKTFITKKLTEELGAGFIKKSLGEFGSSYMHETTKNIKAFFTGAKKAAENGPVVLFLDEIDSLLSARTNNIDANKAEEVSQFLQEFNELANAQNLIVIAATNRPDHLDSAILRSGRFDKKIYIAAPDFIARKGMFRMYIEKIGRPHSKLDYDKLATLSEGYVSSDIESICDEVARDASQSILSLAASMDTDSFDAAKIEKSMAKQVIMMKDVEKAIADTTSSLKMVDMSIYTKWLEKVE